MSRRRVGQLSDDETGSGDLPHRVVSTAELSGEHVLRAQAGDEAAFVLLYRAVQPGLLRYLRVLAAEEAEDLAAETWAQVCRDLGRFHGDAGNFQGWVITIGRHRALDHLRRTRRRPITPVPTSDLPVASTADDALDAAVESLGTSAAVRLIAALPSDQAEAVYLRAVLGLDARTAGLILGKRAGAVRTAAHRGLRTLARWLTESAQASSPRSPAPRPTTRHAGSLRCDTPDVPSAEKMP